MKKLKGYKFRLKTSPEIALKLRQFAGCSRYVWNYFLAIQTYLNVRDLYCNGYAAMSEMLTELKHRPGMEFLKTPSAQALQQTLYDLNRAVLDSFDPKLNQEFPVFKRKFKHASFRVPQEFKIEGNKVYLPKIGWLRFYRSRPIWGTPISVTVSEKADGWYISIQTKKTVNDPIHPKPKAVGLDMGVVRMATPTAVDIPKNEFFRSIDSLRSRAKTLAKGKKKLSRKEKFSENWKKQKRRIARLERKIALSRNDILHKATTSISKNHAIVCLEDLAVKRMTKSAKGTAENPGRNVKAKSGLNKAILDQGWGEFRRQIEYKQKWRGGWTVGVPPAYTSQKCPACGHTCKENRKTQAKFLCVQCGFTANADDVAGFNILAAGLAVAACGEGALAALAKQELAGTGRLLTHIAETENQLPLLSN